MTDLKKKKETDDKKRANDAKKTKQTKEENEAATKIQAGFRGHQTRKEIKDKKQVRDVRNSKEDIAATKIQSGFRGHKARKEVAEKKAKRTEQKSEEEVAATKIQAGFRGHQERKDINQKKQARNDQQMQEDKAATKIQAGFRGHQARKEVDKKKKDKVQNLEEEKAATKIQAGFRGHQTRKEVQKKKVYYSHEKMSNDFINVGDLAVVEVDNCKLQVESSNTGEIKQFELSRSLSLVSLKDDKDQTNVLTDTNLKQYNKSNEKNKSSALSRGGTHVECKSDVADVNQTVTDVNQTVTDVNQTFNNEMQMCNSESNKNGDEINLSSETENDQDVEREVSKDKIVLLPEISNKIDGDVENEVSKDKILLPPEISNKIDKSKFTRSDSKGLERKVNHDHRFLENREKSVEINKQNVNQFGNMVINVHDKTEHLPSLFTCKSMSFIEHDVKGTGIDNIRYGLRRCKTSGRMNDLKLSDGQNNGQSLHDQRQDLKLPSILLSKSQSFNLVDSLNINLVDSARSNKSEMVESDRCKSADISSIPNNFPGPIVKNNTVPNLLDDDFEKTFAILVARSKRHKSFPYFELRKSYSINNRTGSGLRSATDSQASDLIDLGYYEARLHNRSPGDGQSLTVSFEVDNAGLVRVDSRLGKLSHLGQIGSFGDTESLCSESILKTSRTGSLDESLEIDWKKKDTSLIHEIENEEIELELINMKYLAATYLQAGVKGWLSRNTALHRLKFETNSEEVTALQASVRGMICRKHLDFQLHEADTEVEAICQTDAAIKIQALYRGYRVRKMNKAKTHDKKLNVKKQVTFGEVSRIEIFDGECKRDTVVIQKGIKDEEDGTNSYKEENGKNNTGETIDQNKKHAAEIIHIAYRKYKSRQTEKKSLAITVVQTTCHSFLSRKRGIEWLNQREKSDNTLAIIRASFKGRQKFEKEKKLSQDKDIDEAVTKLQAAVRSKCVRDKHYQIKRHAEDKAASQIQSSFRQFLVKKEQKKQIQNRRNAAILICAGCRGFIMRQELKTHKKRIDRGKILIQASVRGFLVRKDLKNQKEIINRAAVLIQVSVRRFLARKKLKRYKVKDRVEMATILIQASCRGFLTRKEHQGQKEIINRATIMIQAAIRGFIVRKKLKKQTGIINRATILIQAALRGFIVRKDLQVQKEIINRATILIQAALRGFIVRKQCKNLREREDRASRLIQTAVKVWLNRKQIHQEMLGQQEKKEKAALVIQKAVREYLTKMRTLKEKLNTEAIFVVDDILKSAYSNYTMNVQNETMTAAAIVIQCRYRGYRSRVKYTEIKVNYAVTVLQSSFKCKMFRDQVAKDQKFIAKNCKLSINSLQESVNNNFERSKMRTNSPSEKKFSAAVTCLQAAYKAHKTRILYKKQFRELNSHNASYLMSALDIVLTSRSGSEDDTSSSKSGSNSGSLTDIDNDGNSLVQSKMDSTDCVDILQTNIQGTALNKDPIVNNSKLPQTGDKSEVDNHVDPVGKVSHTNRKCNNRPSFKMTLSFSSSSDMLAPIKEENDFQNMATKDGHVMSNSRNKESTTDLNENNEKLENFELDHLNKADIHSNEFDDKSFEVKSEHVTKHCFPDQSDRSEILQKDSTVKEGGVKTHYNLDQAAAVIQAAYKAHRIRQRCKVKYAKNLKSELNESSLEVIKHYLHSHLQASFRGYLSREGLVHYFTSEKLFSSPQNASKQKEMIWFVSKLNSIQNGGGDGILSKRVKGFNNKSFTKFQNRHLDEKVDAITVIQAAARGFLVRRRIEKRENTKMLLRLRSAAQEEVMDIMGLIHERDKAATMIQARYRGYKDRKEYKRVKVNEKKEESATFLQAQIRAFLARKDINKRLLMEMRKLDTPSNRQGYRDSLDKVQASFHGYLFRKVAFEKLHQILLRKDEITILQASARAYIERWHIRRRRVASLARYHKAASEMQILFQGYLTRKKIAQNMARRNSSASKIQAGVRGYFARKGYLQQKQAVTRIQSGYRGYRARKQYENLARERRNSAAAVIQSNYRGYKVRKDIKIETRQLAIAQLHASFRGFLVRKEVRIKLNHIEDIKLQKAATKIQTNYRGYADRHKYQIMKRKRVNELRKINATTEMQAQFLGYITRRKLRIKQEAPSVDLKDNTPRFLEGSARFDLQTTGNIFAVRPRIGRLQASLSNVSCEQAYVINNNCSNTTDTADFKSMAQSTSAHVDSFSHLQESFRSLLSKHRKSSKPPQQIFYEKTRLTAVSHVQACFRGFLTRRLISRMCQYDRGQSPINNGSGSPVLPSTTAPILKNPNEIRLSGSYKHPEPDIQHRIMPLYNYSGEITAADETEIPENFSYHRQYSNDEITTGNIDNDTNMNYEIPVQYILRRKSNLSIANSNTVRTSTPVDDNKPVQYLYRSRESTQHQTPGQTYRKSTMHNRYEEPSPIQSVEADLPNPVMIDRSRFEEPSPLMRTSSRRGDEISLVHDTEHHDQKDRNSYRFEEPSPFPGNQNKIDVIQNHDKHTIQDSEHSNPNHSRFEELSPLPSDTDKPDIEYPTSPRDTVHDRTTRDKFAQHSPIQTSINDIEIHERSHAMRDTENLKTNRNRFEEPSTLPMDTVHDFPTQTKSQRNPSSTTLNSNDSEMSIETFSRKLVNEIQSSILLKDEALLVLQAAFKGFLLRNLSHSRHLKKLSKMDVDDKTIFGDTALPFLKAGFKGYLTQTREITSPPEM